MDSRNFCIQWPNWGPYHVARFVSSSVRFARSGFKLWGIETSGSDEVSLWRNHSGHLENIVTLFPERPFESLSPRDIRRKVLTILDELAPAGVAINSYSLPDSQAALEWCITNNRVAVLMTDSRQEDARRSPIKERLKREIIRGFDSALVAGSLSESYVGSLGIPAERIYTPYDVVDNDHFASSSDKSASKWDSFRPYFLASTRDIPRKNLTGLVRAYREYRTMSSDPWRLIILGAEMPINGSEDGIHFAGRVAYKDLPEIYSNAEVFVHVASSDQWGLVINEAMAAGLPLLVSNGTGCAPELLKTGINGFKVDPFHTNEIAQHMCLISSDKVDRKLMGHESEKIISRYSCEAFADALFRAAGHSTGSDKFFAKKCLQVLSIASRKIDSFHSVER